MHESFAKAANSGGAGKRLLSYFTGQRSKHHREKRKYSLAMAGYNLGLNSIFVI